MTLRQQGAAAGVRTPRPACRPNSGDPGWPGCQGGGATRSAHGNRLDRVPVRFRYTRGGGR
jgi:hypothetical protein